MKTGLLKMEDKFTGTIACEFDVEPVTEVFVATNTWNGRVFDLIHIYQHDGEVALTKAEAIALQEYLAKVIPELKDTENESA